MAEDDLRTLAVAPLLSDKAGTEQTWLGASLGKLLTEQLLAAGLSVRHYNAVSEASLALDKVFPLDGESVKALMRHIQVRVLISGGFRVGDNQLHLALRLHTVDHTPSTFTEAAPVKEFDALIKKVVLLLIEKLPFIDLNDTLRQKVMALARPSNFEAFQQVARARVAWADEDFPLALSLAESALSMEKDLEEAAELQIGVGQMADDSQTVIEGFILWIDIAEQHKRHLERAHRLLLYGHWLLGQTKWEAAESAYQEALSVYEEHANRLGKAQALENLAGLLLRRGQPAEAVNTYRRSIAVYQMLGAEQEIATANYNLALSYHAQGQSQLALNALEDVLGMSRRLKARTLEAAALNQRATIYSEEENPNLAHSDYQRALKIYEEENDLPGLATIKDHLALLLAQEGEHAQAEALRLEAIALFEQLGDRHELAVAWANLAALYMEMGAYEQAWDYAQQAHQIFTQLGSGMQQLTERLLAELG